MKRYDVGDTIYLDVTLVVFAVIGSLALTMNPLLLVVYQQRDVILVVRAVGLTP